MAKLLFVVHRYAPFPGGSEFNTQRYAEAALALGHDVTVLAGAHKGDYNGVKLTSDTAVLQEPWDLVIVHGDGPMQNVVHLNDQPNPVYYLLIKPHNNPIMYEGMKRAKWIGCATLLDIGYVMYHQHKDKIKMIKYAICPPIVEELMTKAELVEKFNLDPNKGIVLSCGGFWLHKGFRKLGDAFRKANPQNLQLVLTGYDMSGYNKDNESENVKQLYLEDTRDVYSFMACADQYIMNSEDEGFGLVLLEASYYGTPWLSRPVGGAPDLAEAGLGMLYSDEETLIKWIGRFDNNMVRMVAASPQELHEYIVENHNALAVTQNLLSVLE